MAMDHVKTVVPIIKVDMNARAHLYLEPSWPRTVILASIQMAVASIMEAVHTIALIATTKCVVCVQMDILWHQIGRLAKILMNVWKRTMEAVIKCVSILLEDINANATLDLEKSRSKVRVRTSTNVKIFQPCVVMEIVSIYLALICANVILDFVWMMARVKILTNAKIRI